MPAHDSNSKRESLSHVKNVLYIALSTILKMRKYVKAENIEERDYQNLKVSVLRSNTKSKTSEQWLRDISAAFQSIDLGYLKGLTLLFKEKGEIDTILESYTFEISYKDAHVFISKASTENESLDCANIDLLKIISWLSSTISLMEDLPKGKTGANLSLDYHKRTPINYETKGFGEREVTFNFANDALVYNSAQLDTPYMFMVIKVDQSMLRVESDKSSKPDESILPTDNHTGL